MNSVDIQIPPDDIRFRNTAEYDTGLHVHDNLQVTIALEHSSCEVTWALEDQTYEQKMISAGQICIIPPMLEHRFNWLNKAHFINLHIKGQTVCSVIGDLYGQDEVDLQEVIGVQDSFIQNIGYGLRQTIVKHGDKANGFYRSSLDLVTHYLHQSYAIENKHEILFNNFDQIPFTKIRTAVNYIFHNVDRALSAQEIAKVADMSEFHFLRTFKKMVGISAIRFHMQQRLEKAKEMLIETDKPIVDIAAELGFSSQSYLSTNFSKYIGQTPAKFRRSGKP